MISSTRHRFPETTAVLEQAVHDRVFPGCAFAVLSPRHRDLFPDSAQAIGRFTYEPNSPRVEPGTVFDLASLTKVLATTMAVMQLCDRQQLALDAPLMEWLPEFAAADPTDTRRSRVTLRMLLDHSSGLPGYARLFESVHSRSTMVEACVRQPLTADPGTRAEYSDIGFILLGHLVERLTSERLDSYCGREIFEPLGMSTTRYCPGREMCTSIPPTEDDRSFRHRIIQCEVHDENASVMDGVAGHAGLFSNAVDPLRVARCMLDGGVTSSGVQLFSAQTASLFTKRSEEPPGTSRALGWDTPSTPSSSGRFFSQRSIGHLGYTGTSLWIDLDAGIAVTLLTNRTWPNRSNQAIRDVRPRFHDTLRRELNVDQKS
ncbi:MAG TPA: serine hydrolase domain-containing protein [Bryobacteraceae bacterium]|nr:serine hydrolase domain-containing protein [Bryobacteraceae bacterium]